MTLEQICEVSKVSMLNDKFRERGTGVVFTGGVRSVQDLDGLMKAIRAYDRFTPDNDPWQERDFGSLDWYGDKVFWKIDYYDKDLRGWADPFTKECHRVMTVMLADEY